MLSKYFAEQTLRKISELNYKKDLVENYLIKLYKKNKDDQRFYHFLEALELIKYFETSRTILDTGTVDLKHLALNVRVRKLLRKHNLNFPTKENIMGEELPQHPISFEVLETPVENIVWSTKRGIQKRILNVFKDNDIKLLEDVCENTQAEFLRLPNMGRGSFIEIKKYFKEHKLSFGIEFPETYMRKVKSVVQKEREGIIR